MPPLLGPERDRWLTGRGPLAAAVRLATSVPGQILVNTAAFTLPEELRMSPRWRILDTGCRRASLIRVLAQRAGLLKRPVGLDASREMLRLAQRDIEVEGGPPVSLAQGAATALPFAPETFDLILCAHAFGSLADDDLRACLKEALGALKPGGLFLAWEYAPTASKRLDRWNRWLLSHESPGVRLRSYRELRALARQCGFDWVENARLRPFLFPPMPRVSLIMGKAPPSWRRRTIEGREVLQYAPEDS